MKLVGEQVACSAARTHPINLPTHHWVWRLRSEPSLPDELVAELLIEIANAYGGNRAQNARSGAFTRAMLPTRSPGHESSEVVA
jgi:hypothetical protein